MLCNKRKDDNTFSLYHPGTVLSSPNQCILGLVLRWSALKRKDELDAPASDSTLCSKQRGFRLKKAGIQRKSTVA